MWNKNLKILNQKKNERYTKENNNAIRELLYAK